MARQEDTLYSPLDRSGGISPRIPEGVPRGYRRVFQDVRESHLKSLAFHASKGNALVPGANLGQLSQAYAEYYVMRCLTAEKDVKKWAQRVLDIGEAIIVENHWSVEPSGRNFVGQLLKPDPHHTPITSGKIPVIEDPDRVAVKLARFVDPSELRNGSLLNTTLSAYDLALRFARGLGFPQEESSESVLISKKEHLVHRYKTMLADPESHYAFTERILHAAEPLNIAMTVHNPEQGGHRPSILLEIHYNNAPRIVAS